MDATIGRSPFPITNDQSLVGQICQELKEAQYESLSDFHDQRFLPCARAVVDRVRDTGSLDWVGLLLDLEEASWGLADEELPRLIAEAEARWPEQFSEVRSERGPINREHLEATEADPNWEIAVDESGCRMVFVATKLLPKSSNGNPMGAGILQVINGDSTVLDQFYVLTGGGAANFQKTNGPLPPGRYKVDYYRANRDDKPTMGVDGVSYSFNLSETDDTEVYGRSLFRIHPDGGPIGTYGCLGIVGNGSVQQRFEDLAASVLANEGGDFVLSCRYNFSGDVLEAAHSETLVHEFIGLDAFHVIQRTRALESFESKVALETLEAPRQPVVLHPEAQELIVRFETGGYSYYMDKLARPTWPGYASGLTIGFGFDLGYYSQEAFISAWAQHLNQTEIDALLPAIGLRSSGSDRRSNIQKLCVLEHQLRDIHIPWEIGEAVFLTKTILKFYQRTALALPSFDQASVRCQGSMLSLVFNRGASFHKSGGRFREMRTIYESFVSGHLEDVPEALRSMTRLWPDSPPPYGLQGRREEEAQLFERGLG